MFGTATAGTSIPPEKFKSGTPGNLIVVPPSPPPPLPGGSGQVEIVPKLFLKLMSPL